MALNRKVNTSKPQFDLKTHIRDSKGNIVRDQTYRLTILNGVKEFERPPGSGFIYDEAGALMRSPKPGTEKVLAAKSEFTNDSLALQMQELQYKLDIANEKLAQHELEKKDVGQTSDSAEVNMTAQDVIVDDILSAAAGDVDNSEEIALMEQAGATAEAAKVKAASKPLFSKPQFMK